MLIYNSCTKKLPDKLDGFGEIKLGMTIKEFEKKFDRKLHLKPSYEYGTALSGEVTQIKMLENTILDTIHVEFLNNKLVYISSANDSLYSFLNRNYQITSREKIAHITIGSYETGDENVRCEFVLGKSNGAKRYKSLGIFYLDNISKGIAAYEQKYGHNSSAILP